MLTIVVTAFLAGILIADFLTFDRLIILEYRRYRKHWDADGQPHGFFWVPPEARRLGGWGVSLRSSLASKRCSYAWLFSTPSWVQEDDKAKQLLSQVRILTVIWNAGILISAFFTFLR